MRAQAPGSSTSCKFASGGARRQPCHTRSHARTGSAAQLTRLADRRGLDKAALSGAFGLSSESEAGTRETGREREKNSRLLALRGTRDSWLFCPFGCRCSVLRAVYPLPSFAPCHLPPSHPHFLCHPSCSALPARSLLSVGTYIRTNSQSLNSRSIDSLGCGRSRSIESTLEAA